MYEHLAESFAYLCLVFVSTVLGYRSVHDCAVLVYLPVGSRQLLWNLSGKGREEKGKEDTGMGPLGAKSLNH